MVSSYSNFLLWINNTDHLNRIIHKNHFIYDVIKNNSNKIIIEELKLNFEIIINLLKLIKEYFEYYNI